MTYKIVISKSGYNVLTETNINNLIFSSNYNTLKYYASGNSTISINNGGGKYHSHNTIAHNLGYKPFFVAYAKDSDFMARYSPCGIYVAPTGLSYRLFTTTVDNNNLYLVAKGNSLAGENYSVTFYYKIFKNSLGL